MLRVAVADSSFGPASLPIVLLLVRMERSSLGGNSANGKQTLGVCCLVGWSYWNRHVLKENRFVNLIELWLKLRRCCSFKRRAGGAARRPQSVGGGRQRRWGAQQRKRWRHEGEKIIKL